MKQSFLFLYKITYNLSSNYPQGNYASIIQMLCNSIGVILLSSSISTHKQNSFFCEYLNRTTALHSTSSLSLHYNKLSVISFCVTITYIITLSLSIMGMKHNSKHLIHKVSTMGMLLCSRLIYIFNVLSSFLLEYYSIGIVNVFIKRNLHETTHNYIRNINEGELCKFKILIAIMNVLNIIFMFVLFGFSRAVFRDHDNHHLNILNQRTIYVEAIYAYYQAIYGMIEIVFVNDTTKIANMNCIFTCVIIAFVVFDEFIVQWRMYLRHEINVLFRKFLNHYFLLSSLIELSIRIVNTNKHQHNIKQHMMNFKFFSKLALSLLSVYVLYKYKHNYYQKTMIKQLFQELKGKDVDTLIYFLEMIIENEDINHGEIVDIIIEHKYICKQSNTSCPCKLFTEDLFKGNNLKNFLAVIAEHELTLKINYLYNEHATRYLDDIILMHILFVLYIRQNDMSAFYLCTAYSYHRQHKGNFYLLYVLYKIRRDIVRKIDLSIKGVAIQNNFLHRGICLFDMKGIAPKKSLGEKQKLINPTTQMKYILLSEKLLQLIFNIVCTLEDIIKYRQHDTYAYMNVESNNNTLYKTHSHFSETFFNKLNQIKYTIKRISHKLNKYYNVYCHKVSHSNYVFYPEFQFILYHYYALMKTTPNPIESIPLKLFQAKQSIEIKGIGIVNPLILVFDIKDDMYKIKYINYITATKLKETKQSLIGKPFNAILPYYLSPNHDLAMKIYSLNKNNLHYYSNKTFLIDKYQNLLLVEVKFSLMPSIKNIYTLIIDTQFQEDNNYSSKTIYYLFLSDNNKILSFSNNFLNNFILSRKMLYTLNINAYQLFGVDFANRNERSHNHNNITDLVEINNSLTVFSKVDNYMLRDYKRLQLFSNKKFTYKEGMLNREQFVNHLLMLEKHIVDMNVDFEYSFRVQCLRQRITYNKKSINEQLFKFKFAHRALGDTSYVLVQIEENEPNAVIKESLKSLRFKLKGVINFNEDKEGTLISMEHKQSNLLTKLQIPHHNDTERSIRLSYSKTPNHYSNIHIYKSNSITNKSKESSQLTVHSSSSGLINQSYCTLMSTTQNNNQSNSNIILLSNATYKPSSIKYKSNIKSSQQESKATPKIDNNDNDYYISSKHISKHISKALNIKSIFLLSNHIYLVIVIILLIGLFSVNIYNIVFHTSTLNNIQTLSQINFNAILLKGDIIDLGIYFIVLCLLTDNLTAKSTIINEDNYREITNLRTNNILNHLQKVISKTNELNSINGIDKVFASLSYENIYLTQSFDGYLVEKKATFGEEIRQVYYYAVAIAQQDKLNYCFLIDYLQFAYNGNERFYNEYTNSTLEKRFLFYCLNNILSKLNSNCLNLSMETDALLVEYHNKAKTNFLFTNIFILFLIFFLYLLIVFSIFKDKYQITSFIIAFLMQSQQTETTINDTSKRIKSYKQCITNFTYDNLNSFIIASQSSSLNQTVYPQYNKKYSKRYSMTLRHNKTKQKEKQYNTIKNTTTDKNVYLIINRHIFTPMFLKYAFILMIVMFIVLSLFQIFSIIYMNTSYNTLLFINQISINFIERFPIIVELLYYYMNAIILNDPYFQAMPQQNGNIIHLSSNYYNISYDISKDTIFQQLGDSGYAYLYYCYLINRDNLQMFMNDDSKSNSLSNTVAFTKMIYSEHDFPLHVSYYYNSYFGKECSKEGNAFYVEQCFNEIVNGVQMYLINNQKIMNESALILMTSMIEELNHMYIDYIYYEGVANRLEFLVKENFIVTVENIMGIFYNTHLVYTKVIDEDLKKNYYKYKTIEVSLSLLSIISNLVMIIVTFMYVINKIRNYISLLKHEGKTVYDALTKENKREEEQQHHHHHQKVTSFHNDEEDNII